MLSNLYPVFLLLATSYADDEDRSLYQPPALAPREAWNARTPSCPLPNNTLPAEIVFLQQTGGEECHVKCMKRVANIQSFQMDSEGLDDISYNFLIGGDGVVYVGRGWYRQGEGKDQGTINVAFIGDFDKGLPNDYQIEAFESLMKMGLYLNLLAEDFAIVETCERRTPNSSEHLGVKLRISDSLYTLPIQCADFESASADV